MPGDEGSIAKLLVSLYGTRDAAQNWAKRYTDHLVSIGFVKGKASPCNFVHEKRDIKLTCHGDDFFIAASLEEIRWLEEKMKEQYEVKTQVLGPRAEGCDQDVVRARIEAGRGVVRGAPEPWLSVD